MFGCSSCATGYTRMMTSSSGVSICTSSTYVASLPTFIAGTNFVQNCQKYLFAKNGSKYQCKICSSGYIPTYTYSACVATISNCVTAQTGTTTLCYTCSTGYNNVGGVCTLPSISNCLTYVTANNPSPQLCSACAIGYSLSLDQTTCTLGSIKYCSAYTSGSLTACTACIANYALLNIANSSVYCYAIPSTTNCAALTSSAGAGVNIGKFACTACASTSSAAYGTIAWTSVSGYAALSQSLCMPVQTVDNCATYDTVSTTISQNSFACLTCNSGYYLYSANNTCIARKVQPTGCLTYSASQDICTSCATGTFLNTTKSDQCVSYPSGIFNCLKYSDPSTCILCNSVSYLNNGICIATTVIANCATYSANYTCTACASGYFLFNSTSCIQATAQNCYTFTSASVCASCDPNNLNMGLQTANGVTSCVLKNVANCAISTSIAPFSCITCNTGYYPNTAGVCTLVTTTIVNCLAYDSPSTCIKCNPPSILNTARTFCNSTYTYSVDTNCAQLALVATPVCSRCNFGYYFSSGDCVACTTTSGCMTCSPTNSTACVICSPGYDMGISGTCVKRAVVAAAAVKTNATANATGVATGATATVKAANILKAIVAFVMFLGLL